MAGTEIPLEARIIAVADSFDAMVADRPYRAGLNVQEALEELQRCAGSQFDPEVVDCFSKKITRIFRNGQKDDQPLPKTRKARGA